MLIATTASMHASNISSRDNMLLTTYLAVLSLMCCLGGVVHGAVTFMRSNADGEVGLSLYTDWQPKTKTRALASHASMNNRQEERAPCLTRGTRFKQESVLLGTRYCRFKIKGWWERTTRLTRTVRVQRARAYNLARVRVPSFRREQRTHALASFIRIRTCSRSLVLRPPRPKWACTCAHATLNLKADILPLGGQLCDIWPN